MHAVPPGLPITPAHFTDVIWSYYREHKRIFPWRHVTDPYVVVVSEIMLQQTQTVRVMQKYAPFVAQFPNFKTLADAPLAHVLSAWQGLGYNRRAIALHKIAQKVVHEYDGKLPCEQALLQTFPHIGPNTAGSISAFAFNKPTIFIETNIRSVFIHFFFKQSTTIHDKNILVLVEQTVDAHNPREWYYALMDYGVMLKKKVTNPNRNSAHYTIQSKFEGSHRQIRGMILKVLTQYGKVSHASLEALIEREPESIARAINELHKEGFITIDANGAITLC
jgi:A/G-specific adenine glycosylase